MNKSTTSRANVLFILIVGGVFAVHLLVFSLESARLSFLTESAGPLPAPLFDENSPTGFYAGQRDLILGGDWDGYQWLMHAQALATSGALRQRWSNHDNAPLGRELHWSHHTLWLHVVSGWGDWLLTGVPLGVAIERAGLYANSSILWGALLILPFVLRRYLGTKPAIVGTLMLGFAPPFVGHFAAGHPDHHGLIGLTLLSLLTTLVLGLFRPLFSGWNAASDQPGTNLWMVVAGFLTGLALWMSSAATVQFLGIAGVGIAGSILLVDRGGEREAYLARWRKLRVWGIVGAATSLLFYFVEYFPPSNELRMEVNNPLYAMALVGGTHLLASLSEWRLACASPWRTSRALLLNLGAVALCAAPLLALLLGGGGVFLLSDPFLWELHQTQIAEVQSMAAMVGRKGVMYAVVRFVIPIGAILFLVWSFSRPGGGTLKRGAIVMTLCIVILMTCLAAAQVRWTVLANAIAIAGLLVASALSGRMESRIALLFALAIATWRLLPAVEDFVRGPAHSALDPIERLLLGARDVSRQIKWHLPAVSKPTVLSSPTTANILAYFTGGSALGTYYWENIEGLRATEDCFAENDPERLRLLFSERGVTHVILPKQEFALYRRNGNDPLLIRLLAGNERVDWLVPVVPATPFSDEWSPLFEFCPNITPVEAAIRHMIYRGLAGDAAGAGGELTEIYSANSDSALAGLLSGMLAGEAVSEFGTGLGGRLFLAHPDENWASCLAILSQWTPSGIIPSRLEVDLLQRQLEKTGILSGQMAERLADLLVAGHLPLGSLTTLVGPSIVLDEDDTKGEWVRIIALVANSGHREEVQALISSYFAKAREEGLPPVDIDRITRLAALVRTQR